MKFPERFHGMGFLGGDQAAISVVAMLSEMDESGSRVKTRVEIQRQYLLADSFASQSSIDAVCTRCDRHTG